MFGGKLVNCGSHRDYIPTHSASFGIVPLTSAYIIHLGIHNDFYIPKKHHFLPDVPEISGFISPDYFTASAVARWSSDLGPSAAWHASPTASKLLRKSTDNP